MLPAGFLQEPAVSLNHIIRIGQHQVGEFKYLEGAPRVLLV